MNTRHPEFDINDEKIRARKALISFYYELTGKRKLRKNEQYWTLCSVQSKKPGSEIEQMTQCGFIDKNQFYGVDISKEKIKKNKKLHPEAHWFHGDWISTIMGSLEFYNPSVVYLDSSSVVEGRPIVELTSATLDYTSSGIIFVNMMLNNPHSGERFSLKEYLKKLVENMNDETRVRWHLQPRKDSYSSSGKTKMTTLAFTSKL